MAASLGKPLNVGLAGFGTVGSGLAEVLRENRDWVASRLGRPVVLKAVAERNPALRPAIEAHGAAYADDWRKLVDDPGIDVVVELIGGTGVARECLRAALEKGKHAVTANKALLAEHGAELFPLAAKMGAHLGYEASVAGGIPLVQTFKGPLAANRTLALIGILNGTANFILTEMSQRGMDFAAALKMAQDKGFAEADPTLDIEGVDTAHKLVLLIRLAFGKDYPLARLPVTGITVVTPMDIAFAREFGYGIKLLAQAREVDGRIEAGVYPALVPDHYLLAQVSGSFNAVRLEGNAGPIMLYGHGAGALPTGSAVLADIMHCGRGCAPDNTGFTHEPLPAAEILDLDEAVSLHYLRFMVPDRPGVLRDLGGAMADHGISIAQVIQKGEDAGHGVPIVLLTHEAKAGHIHAAMRQVADMGLALDRTMHYRIL
ncbi:MAG: homoserine dehydrogenase [Thermodesulfobacteriota bacterium]